MLFRSRHKPGLAERLRLMVLPRRSLSRSLGYFGKRILRLRATPHAVAAGVGVGVFVSFLPIPGFHILVAAGFAWLIAGNVVAAALGSTFGNPLTLPAIWAATYELGHLMLDGHQPGAMERPHFGSLFRHAELSELWTPLLKPMTVGALPLGLVFGLAGYALTRWAVARFHARRREKLTARNALQRTLPATRALVS